MKTMKIIKTIGMLTVGIFGIGVIAIPTMVLTSCSTAETKISFEKDEYKVTQSREGQQQVIVKSSVTPNGIANLKASFEGSEKLPFDIEFVDNNDGTGTLTVTAGVSITSVQTITITATCDGTTDTVDITVNPAETIISIETDKTDLTQNTTNVQTMTMTTKASPEVSPDLITLTTDKDPLLTDISFIDNHNGTGVLTVAAGSSITKTQTITITATCKGASNVTVIVYVYPSNINENLIYTAVTGGYTVKATPDTVIPGELVIPNTYMGQPVVSIEPQGFFEQKSITSLTLPDKLLNTGTSAFAECESLTNVIFPDSLEIIAARSFQNCTNLPSITLGPNVSFVGMFAFSNSLLTSITISKKLTTIEQNAFSRCPLTSITIDPDNPVYKKATNVGPDATVIVSGSEGKLNSSTNNMVANLVVGDVVIPETVNSWAVNIWSSSHGLTSITLPPNINAFPSNTFYGCKNLASITFNSTTPPTLGTNVFTNINPDYKIYVPKDALPAYQAATVEIGWTEEFISHLAVV